MVLTSQTRAHGNTQTLTLLNIRPRKHDQRNQPYGGEECEPNKVSWKQNLSAVHVTHALTPPAPCGPQRHFTWSCTVGALSFESYGQSTPTRLDIDSAS